MITVQTFTFNPIQENTYLLYDETGECVIIDPGCYDDEERSELKAFIESKSLKPVHLLNTHCHLDHVFGNAFVATAWKLALEIHKKDQPVLDAFGATAKLYGMNAEPSPQPGKYIDEGDRIKFGHSELEIAHTPGHSPGSISFFSRKDKFIIAGDVLFFGSVGRTDLPGGDFQTLMNSIKEKLFPLGDDMLVYSGHGPATNIGYERVNNPFIS